MQISDRAISLSEKCRADEGKATARTEGGQDFSRDWRDTASLIIGLNVANADFDESSGFECPLRYVTVTLASQLTN